MHATAPSLTGNNISFTMRYAVKRARFASTLLGGGRPIVTYAAYRTASTAIHHAIRRASFSTTVKAHMLAPVNMVARVRDRHAFSDASANIPVSCHVGDWAVRLGIIEPQRAADFVIPIRDPWSVASSIFVLMAPKLDPLFASMPSALSADERAQRVDRAEAIIFGAFPRELMSRWIRDDVAPALAWNPLEHSFDRERGASDYTHGPWRIQMLRVDLSDERKSLELQQFLHRPRIRVIAKNSSVSFGQQRSAIALIAREAIGRRSESVRALLDDPVCRHYWSDADLARMTAKWSAVSV